MTQKAAEISGTYGMPNSAPANKKVTPSKAVINKTAEGEGPDDNLDSPVSGEQPKANAQSGPLKPHVNVEGKEAPVLLQKKEAQHYAMPTKKKYPLDGYDQVIKAASYFDEWGSQMAPEERHEYCVNLVKRASVLDIRVSSDINKYGSERFAPEAELKIALGGRRNVLQDEDQVALLDKLAELRPMMNPEAFAVSLQEFDKQAGIDWMWNEHIMDPYLSTFGKTSASHAAIDQSPDDQDGSFVMGNEIVTAKQLKAFAATHSKDITDTFGEDFMNEFRKDPVTIFKSLPLDQKKVICRQANENSPH